MMIFVWYHHVSWLIRLWKNSGRMMHFILCVFSVRLVFASPLLFFCFPKHVQVFIPFFWEHECFLREPGFNLSSVGSLRRGEIISWLMKVDISGRGNFFHLLAALVLAPGWLDGWVQSRQWRGFPQSLCNGKAFLAEEGQCVSFLCRLQSDGSTSCTRSGT